MAAPAVQEELCKLHNDLGEIPKITFSADATLLACTAGKTRVHLWSVSEAKLKWSASVDRRITSLSFDPTSTAVIAQCADKTIRRLAVETP